MKDFRALIIGDDINAYYLARCYHEYTGKKADMFGLLIPGQKTHAYTRFTKILNIKHIENLWEEKVFLDEINKYYENHKDEKILLVSSNETYGEFIAKNKDILKDKFYFNYPSVEIQHTLVNKEDFYKTYENSILDLPKTIYFKVGKDKKISKDISFPVIVKPANVVKFKHISFKGKKKIYKLNDMESLKSVISYFENSEYNDTLIIQEYIPGDDSHLHDAVVYVDKNHKVQFVSFAQIGLQEHQTLMIGNAAILINGYTEFPGMKEQIEKIRKFMESIDYTGFAEFDMKYDARDKKYKVMEINARQGRCSYYVAPCGFNLIKVLADDLIYDVKKDYQVCDKVQLLTYVPKSICKKYVTNEKFKKKALSLWKHGVDPLDYKKDNGILRWLLLQKIDNNYRKHYKEIDWDWR